MQILARRAVDAGGIVARRHGGGGGHACSSTPPVLVDTVEACQRECARLAASGVVAVDFEGVDLCRDGELLLAQLAAADGPVVLVDVYKLGEAAFAEGGLRDLLQSQQVLKLIFDGRSDSDALYHLHKCRLRQVCDIQILFTLHLDFASTTGKPMTHLSGWTARSARAPPYRRATARRSGRSSARARSSSSRTAAARTSGASGRSTRRSFCTLALTCSTCTACATSGRRCCPTRRCSRSRIFESRRPSAARAAPRGRRWPSATFRF